MAYRTTLVQDWFYLFHVIDMSCRFLEKHSHGRFGGTGDNEYEYDQNSSYLIPHEDFSLSASLGAGCPAQLRLYPGQSA
jgi:hypothetical protein